MPIDHWMLFGTFAEQRHFTYPTADTYKGVIINGNMAAYAPDGLAAFLLERTGLTYFIDPMTHAFQHDPAFITDEEGRPKSSIAELAQHYDPGKQHVARFLGEKPLLPSHLENDTLVKDFVERCVAFQQTILSNAMETADAMKYVLFDEPKVTPHAIIAPYFYLTESNYERWLDIQIKCCQLARTAIPSERLYAGVVLSRGVLSDQRKADQVAEAMLGTNVDGYLLWIDNFDEHKSGENELQSFLRFARKLRSDDQREVINLHGGYFSILAAGNLGNHALTGVTHAPEFGEYRPVVPVGGGIPIARYYIPQLHARVRYRDALRLFGAMDWLKDAPTFHKDVCDCEECVATLNGDSANFVLFGEGSIREVRRGTNLVRIDFPTTATRKRCLRHYLQRKRREFIRSDTASADELRNDLHANKEALEPFLGDGVAHLDIWNHAFSS